MSEATLNQPDPETRPESVSVAPFVVDDIVARARMGVARYGTPLRTFNGRDPLVDCYQEALDLVFYLKQHLMERESAPSRPLPLSEHSASCWLRGGSGDCGCQR